MGFRIEIRTRHVDFLRSNTHLTRQFSLHFLRAKAIPQGKRRLDMASAV